MRLWVFVVLGCVGCAGSAKPSASSAASAVAPPATADEDRRPYAELTEPAAADAVASPGIWVQLKNVAQVSSKLPSSLQTEVPGKMLQEIAQTVSTTLGADVASVIDLAQPVEVSLSVPQGFAPPFPVFAFRVRSPEAIERGQAGLTLRRLAAGMWQLGDFVPPEPEPDYSEMDDDEAADDEDEGEDDEPQPEPESRTPCLLAHAPAPVGYRVLCGVELEQVREYAPFLLRDTPAPSADIHVELSGPTYQSRMHSLFEMAATETEREQATLSGGEKLGSEAGLALVKALAAHERIALDVTFAPTGIEAVLDLAFPKNAATAELEQWAAWMSTRRLPKSFGLLPADHGLAITFAGLGPKATEAGLSLFLREVFSDMSQEFVLSPQELKEMTAAFEGMVPSDGHFSLAAGINADAAKASLTGDKVAQADLTQRPLTPAAVKELQSSLAGWLIVGVDVPPKDYMPAVERMLRANAIPMRRRPGVPRKDSDKSDTKLLRRPLTTAGLPAGTLHLVDQVRPAKTYRAPLDGSEPAILPYDSHVLVVPDGQRVWLVSARDEAAAGQRALSLVRASQPLGQAPEIEKAAERPLIGAWSFTPTGLMLQGLAWNSRSERDQARFKLRLYGNGTQRRVMSTPMLVTIEVAPPPPNDAPGFGFRARLLLSDKALGEFLSTVPPPIAVPPP